MPDWVYDGLIACGDAIRPCREEFPEAGIDSPGIWPEESPADDHGRHTTPGQAIRLGADHPVVGRPIIQDESPGDAAERMIKESDEALA